MVVRISSAILSAWLDRGIARSFLSIALARQCGLDPLLLARLQIIRMPFDVLDNLFLQYLALETAQRTFDALAVLDVNVRQLNPFPSFPL